MLKVLNIVQREETLKVADKRMLKMRHVRNCVILFRVEHLTASPIQAFI